jgi:hypothetical protein
VRRRGVVLEPGPGSRDLAGDRQPRRRGAARGRCVALSTRTSSCFSGRTARSARSRSCSTVNRGTPRGDSSPSGLGQRIVLTEPRPGRLGCARWLQLFGLVQRIVLVGPVQRGGPGSGGPCSRLAIPSRARCLNDSAGSPSTSSTSRRASSYSPSSQCCAARAHRCAAVSPRRTAWSTAPCPWHLPSRVAGQIAHRTLPSDRRRVVLRVDLGDRTSSAPRSPPRSTSSAVDQAEDLELRAIAAAAADLAQVMRLRSRCESCGRSQTSPNSTSSVTWASLGAISPRVFWRSWSSDMVLSIGPWRHG